MLEKAGGILRGVFNRGKKGPEESIAPVVIEQPVEAAEMAESLKRGLPPEQPVEKPVPNIAELKRQKVVDKKTQEILTQLELKEGRKGLVMIVDDSVSKEISLTGEYGFGFRLAQDPQLGYVISTHSTGREAVEVYTALRTREEGNYHSVIILMDGSLELIDRGTEKIRTGVEVAKEIVSVSDLNGWPKPYLIGESGSDGPNKALQKTFPDLYIGTINQMVYLNRQPGIFAVIESKFQ